jgi:hypothetical protein
MAIMGEKLGGDPQIGQPACYRLGWESFFSGAAIRPTLLGQCERLSCTTYHEHVCVVYQVSSTGCTSIQIITTLRYE